jgi:hypothetical protein
MQAAAAPRRAATGGAGWWLCPFAKGDGSLLLAQQQQVAKHGRPHVNSITAFSPSPAGDNFLILTFF